MILWNIFNALRDYHAGLDSGSAYVYNIFNREEQRYKEKKAMGAEIVSLEYLEVCKNHPEAVEIFKLEKLIRDAGYDFWFNVQDDYNLDDDVFDEEYEYIIEVQTGELIDDRRTPITVFLNPDGDGLELLDMRPARDMLFPNDSDGELHSGISAEEAMEIIEKFFKEAK